MTPRISETAKIEALKTELLKEIELGLDQKIELRLPAV